ncbi:MAG: SDR family oxidoreductase [Myxococcales bacterium]|nr:SDR family oxidoreductase [Myxococcales bacterium]
MSPRRPVQTVVVTGSTRGIGRAIVEGLLARGANAIVCGRDAASTDEAVRELSRRFEASHGRAAGIACDVRDHDSLVALWNFGVERFGAIDAWINNAGTCHAQLPFARLAPSELATTVQSNFLGAVLGSRVALERMIAQGHGALYNMEGFGSDGATQLGMSTYGATKSAVRYLTRALAAEYRSAPVQVCALSPGVVYTDLLVRVYEQGDPELWRKQQRLFRFIADPPGPVGDWLAGQVLTNARTDVRIAWMTVAKAIGRFLRPSFHRRDLLAEYHAGVR